MPARRLEGTGEIFADGISFGVADYALISFQNARGKGADGTLTFHDQHANVPSNPNLTIRLESGVEFKVVVTRKNNGKITVSSNGPLPGL